MFNPNTDGGALSYQQPDWMTTPKVTAPLGTTLGPGADPASLAFQQANGGNPGDPDYLQKQQALYNPGGLMDQFSASRQTPTTSPNPSPTSSTTPNGAYTPPAPATVPTGTVANPNTSNSAFLSAYQNAMLGQLKSLQTPTGIDDPNVRPAIDANHLTSQRGLTNTQNTIAEQMAANGLIHSGAFDTAKQRAAEDAAASEANFAGTAVTNQNAVRQGALSNLLGLGSQQQINATNVGLGQQQLAQQNTQFGDNLGFQYTNLGANMNQQALLALLTGGGGGGL